ncbi:MAG: hypothetical protein EOO78_09070, partial [Oxalobacteraceae bacterium]
MAFYAMWAAPQTAAAAAKTAVVSPERQEFWRQGLPTARRFVPRSISQSRLGPADENNDTYYEASDAKGALCGYVRDFLGPVSPNQ